MAHPEEAAPVKQEKRGRSAPRSDASSDDVEIVAEFPPPPLGPRPLDSIPEKAKAPPMVRGQPVERSQSPRGPLWHEQEDAEPEASPPS